MWARLGLDDLRPRQLLAKRRHGRPDKIFIGAIERGFDFLGYHFGPDGQSVANRPSRISSPVQSGFTSKNRGRSMPPPGLGCTWSGGSGGRERGWPGRTSRRRTAPLPAKYPCGPPVGDTDHKRIPQKERVTQRGANKKKTPTIKTTCKSRNQQATPPIK